MKRLLLCFLALMSTNVLAYNQQHWQAWVAEIREEAIQQGIRSEVFDRAFQGVLPDRKTIRLDRTQPERRITFSKYRKTRATRYRINMGKKRCKKYHDLLTEIGDHYGVDPKYLVTFWGMESSYGHFVGSFPVIRSLATLTYEGRREAFFREQLFAALRILNEGHVSLSDFKGEWAGGTGQPQFLPTSWEQYAVDYNGDGKKDIWYTKSDVFGSIANYLIEHGWRTGEPWGYEVILPTHFNDNLVGSDHRQSVADWQAQGVRLKNGKPLPDHDLDGWIITPDQQTALLVFNNFKVFKAYNNSTFYAGTIGYMSDRVCQ